MGYPDDDQSILIETSSCNLQFFLELIAIHMVSPQVNENSLDQSQAD